MKRWAVFKLVAHYPAGGMGDFLGAFDTEDEAKLFILRRMDSSNFEISDMRAYLNRPSPYINSAEEYNILREEKKREREEQMKDPINKKMAELVRRMQKDMYYPDK